MTLHEKIKSPSQNSGESGMNMIVEPSKTCLEEQRTLCLVRLLMAKGWLISITSVIWWIFSFTYQIGKLMFRNISKDHQWFIKFSPLIWETRHLLILKLRVRVRYISRGCLTLFGSEYRSVSRISVQPSDSLTLTLTIELVLMSFNAVWRHLKSRWVVKINSLFLTILTEVRKVTLIIRTSPTLLRKEDSRLTLPNTCLMSISLRASLSITLVQAKLNLLPVENKSASKLTAKWEAVSTQSRIKSLRSKNI